MGNCYICGLINEVSMEKSVSPGKSGLIFGILFGVIMVLEFVIMYIIGMRSLVGTSAGVIVNIANYLILPLIFIYLGCINYKKNLNNGFISFGESLKIGVSITFIAGLVYGLFNIAFNFIFPEFINEMISISKNEMIKQNPNITSKEMEMGLTMMKKFMNPLIVFPVTLAMYSFIGLIYSLIVGAIVKNENPQSL
jgi:tetrahydromethanopterin S-methyltransferase subunit F